MLKDVEGGSRLNLAYSNYEGKTILDVAKEYGNMEMVQFIEEKEYERYHKTAYKKPLIYEAVPPYEQKQKMIEQVENMTEAEVDFLVDLYGKSDFTKTLSEKESDRYGFFDMLTQVSSLDKKQTMEAIQENANEHYLKDMYQVLKKEILFLEEDLKTTHRVLKSTKERRLGRLKENEPYVKQVLIETKEKQLRQSAQRQSPQPTSQVRRASSVNPQAQRQQAPTQATRPVQRQQTPKPQVTQNVVPKKETTSEVKRPVLEELIGRKSEQEIDEMVSKFVENETYQKLDSRIEKGAYLATKVVMELCNKEDNKEKILNEVASEIAEQEGVGKKDVFTAIRRSLSLEYVGMEKKEMQGETLTPAEKASKKDSREFSRIAANLRIKENSASNQMGM